LGHHQRRQDILAGNVGALAAKVEAVMASAIPVVLDFLATLIGIGGKITEIIQKALKSVTQPIQDAIDAVLLAIKKAIGGFIDRLLGKGKPGEAPAEVAPGTPMTTEQIIAAIVPKLSEPTKSTDPAEALAEKKAQAEQLKKTFQPSAPEGKTLHIEFKDSTGDDVAKDHEVDMVVGFSPGTPVGAPVGRQDVLVAVLKPTAISTNTFFAEANPLTGGAKGQRTSGGIDEPFSSARKVPSARALRERARRKREAEAKGRPFAASDDPFSSVYVRSHLISAALGGTNDATNLQVTTISVNASLATPERKVLALLDAKAESADGKKVLDASGKEIKKTFEYKVSTEPGPPRQDPFDTSLPHDERRTDALRAAEQTLVKSFKIVAKEKVHLTDGSVVDGKASIDVPVSVKLPATFVPEGG
jgi:hypothetical protein